MFLERISLVDRICCTSNNRFRRRLCIQKSSCYSGAKQEPRSGRSVRYLRVQKIIRTTRFGGVSSSKPVSKGLGSWALWSKRTTGSPAGGAPHCSVLRNWWWGKTDECSGMESTWNTHTGVAQILRLDVFRRPQQRSMSSKVPLLYFWASLCSCPSGAACPSVGVHDERGYTHALITKGGIRGAASMSVSSLHWCRPLVCPLHRWCLAVDTIRERHGWVATAFFRIDFHGLGRTSLPRGCKWCLFEVFLGPKRCLMPFLQAAGIGVRGPSFLFHHLSPKPNTPGP